jgi:hypothetical protein
LTEQLADGAAPGSMEHAVLLDSIALLDELERWFDIAKP